jgi:hypothetical protein
MRLVVMENKSVPWVGFESITQSTRFETIEASGWIYRVSQKYVYTRLIFRIIMCIHLFGIPCIYDVNENVAFQTGYLLHSGAAV